MNATPCPDCQKPIDEPQTCEVCGKVTCADCAYSSEDGENTWCDACGDALLQQEGSILVVDPIPVRTDDWERIEIPHTFGGGTVGIPALRDPDTGEQFYSPDAAQIKYNLTHALAYAPSLEKILGEVAAIVENMQQQLAFLESSEDELMREKDYDTAARYSARASVLRPHIERLAALVPAQPPEAKG